MPKSVFRAGLRRMQFTLHVTRRTPHGASCLVQAMSAWLVKTRCAPSRHSRDARVYGHTTTAMHKVSTPPPPHLRCLVHNAIRIEIYLHLQSPFRAYHTLSTPVSPIPPPPPPFRFLILPSSNRFTAAPRPAAASGVSSMCETQASWEILRKTVEAPFWRRGQGLWRSATALSREMRRWG